MQFVTGGAFNGKSGWVKAYNGLNDENCRWISSYRHDRLPENLAHVEDEVVVLEGMEQWVKELLMKLDAESVRQHWQSLLQACLQWESGQQGRKVILIGCDITKGIVPVSSEDRLWRDLTGRVFQDSAAVCERVDLVWYGINQRLK